MAIFLKIADVDGESTKVGFEGCIEVESVGIGADCPRAEGGTGHSGGQVHLHEVTMNALEGRHSITFWQKLLQGTHFSEIIVKHTKQSGENELQVFKEVTLTDVYVTAQSSQASANSPTYESISLAADKMKIDYLAQNAQGGLTSVGDVVYNARNAAVE